MRYPGRGKSGKRPTPIRLLENPFWPKASTLVKNNYRWASPTYFEPLPFTPPCYPGVQLDSNFFFFLGLYTGDGYLNPKGKEIHISEGYHLEEETFTILSKERPIRWSDESPIHWGRQKATTCARLTICHSELHKWIKENFGQYCEQKTIPGWMFGVSNEWKKAFLQGYKHADGSSNKHRSSITSVSKKLAIGIKILANSLKLPASYGFYPRSEGGTIEGRTLRGKGINEVAWTTNPKVYRAWFDHIHIFLPVKQFTKTGILKEVFNLQVEEDESYTADGIVVHNCTSHSTARGGRPIDQVQDRATPWCVVRWIEACKPSYVFVENVPNFVKWGPVNSQGHVIQAREGETFQAWINAIKALG